MRQPEFIAAVSDYVDWRTKRSKQPHWRYPNRLAVGGYSVNGVVMHFAGVTFLRRANDGTPLHPADVPPRLAVLTCSDDDQPRNWLCRETARTADISYDAATDTVTVQNVLIRTSAVTGESAMVEAVIPFGSANLTGRLGEAALQITDAVELLPFTPPSGPSA